jgi:lauroyl/myristoyl acyltransferase
LSWRSKTETLIWRTKKVKLFLFPVIHKMRSFGDETVESCLRLLNNPAVSRFREMEKKLKERRKLFFFFNVRWMERKLSVRSLYWILGAHAFVRAMFKRNPPFVQIPACLAATNPVRIVRETLLQGYLKPIPEYFPERLAESKWMSRCRIEGLDRVLQARQDGRPVVLAFFHSQAYRMPRFWLRAAGVSVANLIAGKAACRTKLDRLGDGFSPFPEIPTAFYLDQLRQACKFLAAGNSLLVALDTPAGKKLNVPICDGWSFQMSTGAMRLAVLYQAELIPCVVIDEGRWRFHIKLGRPVPAEYLAAGTDWSHAGKHLLKEMLPHFRDHPDQLTEHLAGHFQPSRCATPLEYLPDEFLHADQFVAR